MPKIGTCKAKNVNQYAHIYSGIQILFLILSRFLTDEASESFIYFCMRRKRTYVFGPFFERELTGKR